MPFFCSLGNINLFFYKDTMLTLNFPQYSSFNWPLSITRWDIKWPPVDIRAFDCNCSCNLLKAKAFAFVERRIIPIFYKNSSKNSCLTLLPFSGSYLTKTLGIFLARCVNSSHTFLVSNYSSEHVE